MNVIIVEDNIVIQLFLEQIILDLGYTLIGICDNCEDTIALIDNSQPDFILMDVGICGDKDGIDTTEIINEKYQIPVIFLTGNSDSKTLQRIKEVNPFHILKKPIEQIALVNELEKVAARLNEHNARI